jgi:hypothetical protein
MKSSPRKSRTYAEGFESFCTSMLNVTVLPWQRRYLQTVEPRELGRQTLSRLRALDTNLRKGDQMATARTEKGEVRIVLEMTPAEAQEVRTMIGDMSYVSLDMLNVFYVLRDIGVERIENTSYVGGERKPHG